MSTCRPLRAQRRTAGFFRYALNIPHILRDALRSRRAVSRNARPARRLSSGSFGDHPIQERTSPFSAGVQDVEDVAGCRADGLGDGGRGLAFEVVPLQDIAAAISELRKRG